MGQTLEAARAFHWSILPFLVNLHVVIVVVVVVVAVVKVAIVLGSPVLGGNRSFKFKSSFHGGSDGGAGTSSNPLL